MNLFWHISIHVILSLAAGFIIFHFFRNFLVSMIPALISGVAVDSDHLFDYFLAFGTNFHLNYFLSGYQFLKTSKIYIPFHAWEYVIIALIIAILVKNKTARTIFLSLSLGLFFHLTADSILNEGVKPQAYSIIYRIENNYNAEQLVTTDNWTRHIKQKESVKPETL